MAEKTYLQIRMELEQARFTAMVDAFLSWKLPKDFSPDAGVSFDPPSNELHWPIGTNLFTAEQATKMFKDCIPPVCFGEDDCTSNQLGGCAWAMKCGKAETPNVEVRGTEQASPAERPA